MTKPTSPPVPPAKAGLSRRRLLGGALTASLAAVLVPRDRTPPPRRPRFGARPRWIGHA